MTAPICDFVRRYAQSGTARLHMPGHKGAGPLGCEALDITEIQGADDLADPEGIIAESEGTPPPSSAPAAPSTPREAAPSASRPWCTWPCSTVRRERSR